MLPVMVVTFVIGVVVATGIAGYLIDRSADREKD